MNYGELQEQKGVRIIAKATVNECPFYQFSCFFCIRYILLCGMHDNPFALRDPQVLGVVWIEQIKDGLRGLDLSTGIVVGEPNRINNSQLNCDVKWP